MRLYRPALNIYFMYNNVALSDVENQTPQNHRDHALINRTVKKFSSTWPAKDLREPLRPSRKGGERAHLRLGDTYTGILRGGQ